MDLKSSNSRLIPGIGRIPFPAYRGDEPYIFVSYAHKNAEAVFAEINRWNKQGYNIWYDEGIAPGNEWEEEIAKALENCRLFVVFITPDSIESKNCRDEIYYALDSGLPIIAIHLTQTNLKGGLKLRMSSIQAILKYNLNEEEYIYKYVTAFNEYGFKIPAILRNSEKTDNYDACRIIPEKRSPDLRGRIKQGYMDSCRAQGAVHLQNCRSCRFKNLPERFHNGNQGRC